MVSVIVIGAGAAGLAAAQTLNSAGYDVTVLEARERVGGRAQTGCINGMPIDLGPMWMHGIENNPLFEIASDNNYAMVTSKYDNATYYNHTGHEITDALMEKVWEDYDAVMERVAHYQDSTNSRHTLAWGIQEAVEYLSAKGALSVLDGSALAQRMLDFAVVDAIELEYAGNTKNLDLWWYDSDGELDGGDVLLPGGYVQIMEHIATDLTIRHNSTVTQIEYGESGVKVTVNETETDGDGIVTYSADYCIVTVPVGVLKANTIRFAPSLPDAWTTALSHRGVGLLDKYVFAFKTSFFADTHFLYHVDTTKGRFPQWLNGDKYLDFSKATEGDGTGAHVLAVFNAAAYAMQIGANATDSEVLSAVVEILQGMYPDVDVASEIVDFVRTDWAHDPWALGSYSFNGLGSKPSRDFVNLRGERLFYGRLFFAGEHTHCEFFGTVHGAYMSGLDAADCIIKGSCPTKCDDEGEAPFLTNKMIVAISLGACFGCLLCCLVASWLRDKRPCFLWGLYAKSGRLSLRSAGAGNSASAFDGGGAATDDERERTLSNTEHDSEGDDEAEVVLSTISSTMQPPAQARKSSSSLEMAGTRGLA